MNESPILAFAIEHGTAIDRERLAAALRRIVAQDPTLRMRADGESEQVIVAGTSERQLRSVISRLAGELDVEPAGVLRVIYKEMFTRPAEGEGRFVRQTGGRAQYAHVKIHLAPGQPGSGYTFNATDYSKSIPAQFIVSAEHGIRDALARRSIARSGVDGLLDVTIELHDGSYHEVDSSEFSFRAAGGMALDDAASKAKPALIEPFMQVDVVVPSDCAGDVLEDFSKRRGAILSVESEDTACFISARIPLSTVIGYEEDLQSRTGGLAKCSIKFNSYQPCNVQPDSDNDDHLSSVRMPVGPSPKLDDSSIALPEPDGDDN